MVDADGADTSKIEIVEVTTMSLGGESKVVEVLVSSSASDLREIVATSWGVPLLEVQLVDNATGMNILFGCDSPLVPMPLDVQFVRSSRWAGVPDGLHHRGLVISDDRMRVAHSSIQKNNEACFLSSALEKGGRYTLHLRIEGVKLEGGFVGIVRDTMTEWHYLNGLYVLVRDGRIYDDDFAKSRRWSDPDDLDKDALAMAHESGRMKIVLDTRSGTLELWNEAGVLILSHSQEELARESSLRFAASFYTAGLALEIIDAKVENHGGDLAKKFSEPEYWV